MTVRHRLLTPAMRLAFAALVAAGLLAAPSLAQALFEHTAEPVALVIQFTHDVGVVVGGRGRPSTRPPGLSLPGGAGPRVVTMTLAAAASEAEFRMITFTAEIVGGADNNPDLYCVASTWNFGDGPSMTVSPSCAPWDPDVVITRRFETSHMYAAPGRYEASFAYGPLEARAAVEVR